MLENASRTVPVANAARSREGSGKFFSLGTPGSSALRNRQLGITNCGPTDNHLSYHARHVLTAGEKAPGRGSEGWPAPRGRGSRGNRPPRHLGVRRERLGALRMRQQRRHTARLPPHDSACAVRSWTREAFPWAAAGLWELRGAVLRRHYRATDRKEDGLRCPAGCSGGTTRSRSGGRPAGSFAHAQAARLHEKPVSQRRAQCARPLSVRMRQSARWRMRASSVRSIGRARRGDARRCSAHALPRRLQGRGVTAAGRQSPGAPRAAEGPLGSSAPSTAHRSPRGWGGGERPDGRGRPAAAASRRRGHLPFLPCWNGALRFKRKNGVSPD